jgi:Flp pilus assembly protein TadB
VNGINICAAFAGALGLLLMAAALKGVTGGLFSRFSGKTDRRMKDLVGKQDDPFEVSSLKGSFAERVIAPLLSDVARWLGTTAGTADRDAQLLLQAGYPSPFHTLGDFYAWKVLVAFWFFFLGLVLAAVTGAAVLVIVALGFGIFGLYLPDLSLRQAAHRRQQQFRTELAYTLDRLAMMLGAGQAPGDAVKQAAGVKRASSSLAPTGTGSVAEDQLRAASEHGGGLLVLKLREVANEMNIGRKSLVEALEEVGEEFPLEEWKAFVDAIHLSIEQGAPLVGTLNDMADTLQAEIEFEMLGRGLQASVPMVMGMGVAMLNIFILIGAPLVAMLLSQ